MSESRVYPTVREAIHATATLGPLSMKELAGELDMAPSELSMKTTLGGDSARAFPSELLGRLMRAQNNYSILFTLAADTKFDLQPKKERLAEMVMEMRRSLDRLIPMGEQILLEMPGLDLKPEPPKKGKGR